MAALVAEGAATLDGGTLSLVGTVCAGSDAPPGGPLSALVAAARPGGCALSMPEALAALAPQGIGKDGVSAIARDLEAAGEATLDGATLRLAPGLCAGMPGSPAMDVRRQVAARQWLRARLASAPGCRMPRAALAVEGVAVAIGPADLLLALGDLGSDVVEEGGEVALVPGPCAALAVEGAGEAIAGLSDEALRTGVEEAVAGLGCAVPLGPESARALSAPVAAALGLSDPSPDDLLALAARVAVALDNPGPAYHTRGGDLVLRRCTL